jgi:Flp pilus assembly CpaF family ATPase/MinD-like ATPase involved in chromosome partitioning or flagellar assembly
LVGSKGGVGTSTLCHDLARTIAARGTAALVDADFSGRRSLAVLTRTGKALDAARTSSPVAVAKDASLTIVELTDSYDMALTIESSTVDAVVEQLSLGYAAVLVDAAQPFAVAVRAFIARATRFLLVVRPDLLGMTGARAMLNELVRFGIPRSRIVAVVNWHAGRAEIERREIESALGIDVIAEIPPFSDRAHRRALDALTKTLLQIPEEAPIASLQPSVTAPLGERRREAAAMQRSDAVPSARSDRRNLLKVQIHEELGKRLDFVAASHAHSDAEKLTELRTKIEELTRDILSERNDLGGPEDISEIRREIIDEALGLGPLEDLLADESVTEIMVNGPDEVYVERAGKLEKTSKRFTDGGQLRLVIDRIIAPLGRRIDESVPMVDARLPDGSRVNAIIAPLTLDGAALTIRRFGTKRLDAADLLRLGAVNDAMLEFLSAAIKSRMNVLISGGTGSGKTTLLNILSNFISPEERIVTIEDAAELLLGQPHVVRLESRAANIENHGEIRIRDLVRNALRMRPDRIIVGEVRGAEALDMLQAMNTGHDGSLTTVHANSARDAISRTETLVLMAGFDLPVRAIREQIAGAIDLVVQSARMRDGSRKIVSISEIVGMEGDVVTMQEIVRYSQQGVNEDGKVIGAFEFTGVQPNSLRRFDESGIRYDVRALSSMPAAAQLW